MISTHVKHIGQYAAGRDYSRLGLSEMWQSAVSLDTRLTDTELCHRREQTAKDRAPERHSFRWIEVETATNLTILLYRITMIELFC